VPKSSVVLRTHNHEQRLETAKHFSKKILESYAKSVLAVCITGSTAKKLDRPYSDLEMLAVVKDGVELPTQHYVHNGMVIQIDYPEENVILKDAGRITTEWALAADGFRNRIVLFDPKGWFSKLNKVVAESDMADMKPAIKHGMTSLYETLGVMLNADLTKDERGIRTAAVYFSWDASKLVLMLNRKYVLTSSWFWKDVKACELKPKDFWTSVERLAGFTRASVNEILETARKLCEDMLLIVEGRGISIESSELIV